MCQIAIEDYEELCKDALSAILKFCCLILSVLYLQKLERHFMSYIITYYLPSGLFVVVSWISFLIPPDIVPGRMALLITLFLVLVNIFNNINSNSPKAEGLTAIEIWMLACILFVFGLLITTQRLFPTCSN